MPNDSVLHPGTRRSVIVTGDVTIDWNVARSRQLGSDGSAWNADDSVRAYSQRGGAALLADLIEQVARGLPAPAGPWEVRQPGGRDEVLCPGDQRFHHSYASWSLFPYGEAEKDRGEKKAWRVEEFLGLDNHPAAARIEPWKMVAADDPAAPLVVLDDAGLGFRMHSELWPQAVRQPGLHPWVILKMARPLAHGDLWNHLLREHAERLLMVMAIDDLRRMAVQVSRQLSWEQTAEDLIWELIYNPPLDGLSRSAHLLISFETSGAMLVSRQNFASGGADLLSPRCRLFFDPEVIEGTWQRRHRGGMIGYNTCLAAALARELMLQQPDLERGVQAGLAASRWLHRRGYGNRGALAYEAALCFPVEEAAGELAGTAHEFKIAVVENRVRLAGKPRRRGGRRSWSILEDCFSDRSEERVAEEVAQEGVEHVLPGVPLGRFGKLLTVDRGEIESFRSIAALIGEYCRQDQSGSPVSIAVFGAPGSGKSFGVTEVAESVLPGKVEPLTFNLSQFGHADELLGAFHQVRDKVLAGKIPLVFWDEFDTALDGRPLGWLRHFLAPMQDGRFQHGQITHSIGRSIFVFAGGTSHRLEEFGKGIEAAEFISLKGPDFKSRLKGYVDILALNRRQPSSAEASDTQFLLRRAILLRSQLYRHHRQLFQQKDGKETLQIDPGVLRGFLQTQKYLHGARSLEAIIKMSLLHGKRRFERSSLPAEAQLELHVNARDFLALVHRIELEGERLERLAAATHAVYQRGVKGRGQTTDSAERDYSELPPDEKEQNRASARDISNKLFRIGYVLLPVRGEAVPFSFSAAEIDRLAELEHDRWMKLKLADGWQWADQPGKSSKRHQDLVLWRKLSDEEKAQRFTAEELEAIGPGELPENEKDKDRDQVRAIPEILAKSGFMVAETRAADPDGSDPSRSATQSSFPARSSMCCVRRCRRSS